MSDGFVVYLETEDEERKITYWDGTTEVDSLEDSHVFPNRNDAKRNSGEIQVRYTDHDVKVMPVTVTIQPKV